MRQEYVDAVNAVRWGWSLWAIAVVPALLIWGTAFVRRRRWGVRAACFVVACVLFWGLAVFHANHIQYAKHANMWTVAEQMDWTSDTWRVFAPITAIPWALAFCLINAVVAYPIAELCFGGGSGARCGMSVVGKGMAESSTRGDRVRVYSSATEMVAECAAIY